MPGRVVFFSGPFYFSPKHLAIPTMRIVRLLGFVSVRCRWFLCDENDRMLGHIP